MYIVKPHFASNESLFFQSSFGIVHSTHHVRRQCSIYNTKPIDFQSKVKALNIWNQLYKRMFFFHLISDVLEFFRNSPQYKNANIANIVNFVLAVPLGINWPMKFATLKYNPLTCTDIQFDIS